MKIGKYNELKQTTLGKDWGNNIFANILQIKSPSVF